MSKIQAVKVGLAEYWRLDEVSGNALAWRGLDLTDNATVTQREGPGGRLPFGRQFTNANSEYFNRADPEYLSGPLRAISIAAWVNLDSLGANRFIVAKGTAGTTAGLEYRLGVTAAGNISWFVSDGTTSINVNSTGTLSTGQWYHILVTNNTENFLFMINGAIDRMATAGTPIAEMQNTAGDFYIGRQPGGTASFMDGGICGVGIWHRIVSPTEGKLIYRHQGHLA